MPTIAELRAAFPGSGPITDDMLLSPHYHLGVIQSYLPDLPDRVRLSLAVISDAITADLVMDARCDCGVCP